MIRPVQRLPLLFSFALALFACCVSALAAPVISNTSVTPLNLTSHGGLVTVSATVTSNPSNVAINSVGFTIYRNGNYYTPVNMTLSGGVYTGTYTLPNNTSNAAAVSWTFVVSATDAVGNSATAPAVGPVVEDFDNVPPVISNVSVTPLNLNSHGGLITVSATATDSGVNSFGMGSVGFTIYRNGNYYTPVNMTLSGGVYTGTYTLPNNTSNAAAVSWTFVVSASDYVGNSATAPAVGPVTEDFDNVPPVISNVSVTPATLNSHGGLVTVSATATDSGVNSFGMGSVGFTIYRNGNYYTPVNMTLSGGVYTGTYTLPNNTSNAAAVSWTFVVSATDAVGNSATAPAVGPVVEDFDNVPPVISNVSVTPLNLNSHGGLITVSATATDSGVNSFGMGSVGFTIYRNGNYYTPVNMTLSGGVYTGTYTLPQNTGTTNITWAFRVTATDYVGNSSTASSDVFVIQSQPAITAPNAVNDIASTVLNTPVTFNALSNDSDTNTPLIPLVIASFTQPTHGAVVRNNDNTFTYTPASGYLGGDSFAYTISNGTYTATAQVTLKVRAVTTVSGTVLLENTTLQAQPITLKFRSTDNGISATTTVTPNAAGQFTVSNVPEGTYNLAIKGGKWLQKVVAIDATNGPVSGVSVRLIGGDANNDNSVDSSDFTVLIGSFNSEADIPGSGYNARADFNDDGFVDSSDFTILIGNFGQVGDF